MDLTVESRTPKTVKLDTSSTNIPTAYAVSTGSLVLSGIAYAQNVLITNGASTGLVLNFSAGDPANAPTTDEGHVPASATTLIPNVKLSSTLYVRSDGSAISSGTVRFSVF